MILLAAPAIGSLWCEHGGASLHPMWAMTYQSGQARLAGNEPGHRGAAWGSRTAQVALDCGNPESHRVRNLS